MEQINSYRYDQIRSSVENEQKVWEVIEGDKAIKDMVQSNMCYLGHSTGNIEWLVEGKDLRVGSGSSGSLSITTIEMPSEPVEFLEHLKMRVNPDEDYYNLGNFVVVLAVPPDLYRSHGMSPDQHESVDTLGSAPMKNVKVIEKEGDHYSTPKRFILGYYDGSDNTFHRNPQWEEDPKATEFGEMAEKQLLNATRDTYMEEPYFPSDRIDLGPEGDGEQDVW